MKSSEDTTGASTVCVQSLDTRSVSRRQSQTMPGHGWTVAPAIAFT